MNTSIQSLQEQDRRQDQMDSKKLCSNKGFTIAELMVATMIVLMVSATVVIGVTFSARQYNNSKMRSEAQMLAATLADIVRTELANTRTITLGSKSGDVYQLDKFFSLNYAIKYDDGQTRFYSVDVDENKKVTPTDGYGELMLAVKNDENEMVGHLLLASSAYTEYGLGAKVDSITYNRDSSIFHVVMHVANGNEILETKEFDVIPLNEVKDNLEGHAEEGD